MTGTVTFQALAVDNSVCHGNSVLRDVRLSASQVKQGTGNEGCSRVGGRVEATLHYLGKPTRIPRKWASEPGPGMGCDGQISADRACPFSSNGSPVFLMDTQLLSADLLAFSRTLCPSFALLAGAQPQAIAKQGAQT